MNDCFESVRLIQLHYNCQIRKGIMLKPEYTDDYHPFFHILYQWVDFWNIFLAAVFQYSTIQYNTISNYQIPFETIYIIKY